MNKNFKIREMSVDFLIEMCLSFSDLKDTLHIINHQIRVLQDKAKSLPDVIKLKNLSEKLYRYDNYETETVFLKEVLDDLKRINLEGLYEYEALVYFLEGVTRQHK